jgi:PDZ domain-containing protein
VNLARRRALWRSAAVGVGVVLAAVVAVVPLPFLELSPGPTYNVIGDVNGQPLLKVTGATTYPTEGQLDMTTVSERGGPDSGVLPLRLITGWLDPAVRVLPREAFYPDDISDEDVSQENARLFSDSTATAVAAAAGYLDEPVTEITIVSSVITGSPADGKLEPGDQILEVDGDPVTTPEDVTRAMDDVRPGQTVAVVVDRDGSKLTQQIVTTTNPEKPERAFMGITIGVTYEAPFDVDVTLSTVGGPSAGLFFSLGIVDLLTPGALTEGKHIAGTGTIDPDGTVGPIGGITQKLNGARDSGATLFLVPEQNCAEALANGIPSGLEIAKVTTLDDAVAAVEAYAAGKPVTACTP